ASNRITMISGPAGILIMARTLSARQPADRLANPSRLDPDRDETVFESTDPPHRTVQVLERLGDPTGERESRHGADAEYGGGYQPGEVHDPILPVGTPGFTMVLPNRPSARDWPDGRPARTPPTAAHRFRPPRGP